MKAILIITLIYSFTVLQAYAQPSIKENKLSLEEKAKGWKLLFDGSTMDGWHFYQNKDASSWRIDNGTLLCKGNIDSLHKETHADLITDDAYKNFELSIDWKLTPMANSGIIYLCNEKEAYAFETGPEYQLIDDKGYITSQNIANWQTTGANYAMNPPSVNAASPIGEWNTTVIKVRNGYVEHWLNGKKIVSYKMHSSEWNANKAKGKWKDDAAYGTLDKGQIALQDHNGDGNIWFKNIMIRELK